MRRRTDPRGTNWLRRNTFGHRAAFHTAHGSLHKGLQGSVERHSPTHRNGSTQPKHGRSGPGNPAGFDTVRSLHGFLAPQRDHRKVAALDDRLSPHRPSAVAILVRDPPVDRVLAFGWYVYGFDFDQGLGPRAVDLPRATCWGAGAWMSPWPTRPNGPVDMRDQGFPDGGFGRPVLTRRRRRARPGLGPRHGAAVVQRARRRTFREARVRAVSVQGQRVRGLQRSLRALLPEREQCAT